MRSALFIFILFLSVAANASQAKIEAAAAKVSKQQIVNCYTVGVFYSMLGEKMNNANVIQRGNDLFNVYKALGTAKFGSVSAYNDFLEKNDKAAVKYSKSFQDKSPEYINQLYLNCINTPFE